jgi:hypothetical protein
VYSRAERVFVREQYFASKLSAAVRESFSNGYPDKTVASKTTIHRLGTKCWDTGSVCLCQVGLFIEQQNSLNYDRTDFKQLQQRDTVARIQCCYWFRRFVREAVDV